MPRNHNRGQRTGAGGADRCPAVVVAVSNIHASGGASLGDPAGTTGARWVSGHPGVGPPRAGRPEGYQTVSGTARPSRFAVGYAEPGRPRAGPVDRRSADTRRSHPTPGTARGQARNPSPKAYVDPCAASYRSSTCLALLLATAPPPTGSGPAQRSTPWRSRPATVPHPAAAPPGRPRAATAPADGPIAHRVGDPVAAPLCPTWRGVGGRGVHLDDGHTHPVRHFPDMHRHTALTDDFVVSGNLTIDPLTPFYGGHR
ncbi:hypothetical protein B0E53_00283 [Micromonospora sp. MH33]|nr:hypothetical protein B0E53_00283 [Micromonospora sp. MH33]